MHPSVIFPSIANGFNVEFFKQELARYSESAGMRGVIFSKTLKQLHQFAATLPNDNRTLTLQEYFKLFEILLERNTHKKIGNDEKRRLFLKKLIDTLPFKRPAWIHEASGERDTLWNSIVFLYEKKCFTLETLAAIWRCHEDANEVDEALFILSGKSNYIGIEDCQENKLTPENINAITSYPKCASMIATIIQQNILDSELLAFICKHPAKILEIHNVLQALRHSGINTLSNMKLGCSIAVKSTRFSHKIVMKDYYGVLDQKTFDSLVKPYQMFSFCKGLSDSSSIVSKFFAAKKGIPNHELGDLKLVSLIRKFL